MKRNLLVLLLLLQGIIAAAQSPVKGEVLNALTGEAVAGATLLLNGTTAVVADAKGRFTLQGTATDSILITATGFDSQQLLIADKNYLRIQLVPVQREIDAVVVTGTMKAVRRSESPVAVEVYTPQFLKKNPSPSIFEALQNVNGVRPQLNCSVCNTGDIHINGLEGPYTMVTIDGMPIVSSLSSVYGLFGIPSQLIERVEIVKGPASGLYGAEAIGGLINIITKSPDKAPVFTISAMTSSWKEHTIDAGAKFKLGKKASSLLGVNYFNYQQPYDKNEDGFTDVTLQHRVSVFNKVSIDRKENRVATLAARYFYEDRWGGQTNWNKSFRGGDSIYGESIYTNRVELIGNYQLPVQEKILLAFSATSHDQNSYYGATPYMANQKIIFNQFTWDKQMGAKHSVLTGLTSRYTYYDDNSTATIDTLTLQNRADKYFIPGVFIQDEWKINNKHLLLMGLRYDRHPVHKTIVTPRLAWKYSIDNKQVLRVNAGTGFRVVSLFTEEHAALTGSRAVEVKEALKPEQSYNVNINYTWTKKWEQLSLNVDASAWYSHFTNQIIPDYDTDPNKIIYENLKGYAASKGGTLNLEINVGRRWKNILGVTVLDVQKVTTAADGKKQKQLPVLTERWSGIWAITYSFPEAGIAIDYTGNVYGPMRLPLLSATDPRPAYSPVWSIQNIQVSKMLAGKAEFFAGAKNLLNWTPAKSAPFIIARSHDPFDKKVEYEADGQVKATAENPYALSFDPSYSYAPNQGLRIFAGVRFWVR